MLTRPLLAFGALWLVLILGGMLSLFRYKGAAGDPGHAPLQWPAGTSLAHAADRPTLLVFAHPMCPCTRATFTELARLLNRLDGKLKAEVIFIRLDGTSDEWEHSAAWEQARRIAQVDVRADPEGAEADRFGSATSGQVLLYSAGGELLFHGGITPSRGHEGDNAGSDRIAALVQGERPELASSPVFGCPLHDSPESP